jgi:hypothetical protein
MELHKCDVEYDAGHREIEITSDMIAAGVDTLMGNYLDVIAGPEKYPEIARIVFEAMMAAQPRGSYRVSPNRR